MIDLKVLREQQDLVRDGIRKKHIACDLDAFLKADETRRAMINEVETLRAEQKSANTEMAQLPKGSPEFLEKVKEMKTLSSSIKEKDAALKEAEEKWQELYLSIPNPTHAGSD